MINIICKVFLLLIFIAGHHASAGNLPIGHRTMNFTDAARNNRPVPTEVYYPATLAGDNTPLAAGQFPVLVYGHGFQMGYDSYAWFRKAMVPDGYIMVFPKTEMSLAPSHTEYGADLAFLVVQMHTEGADPASPFFGHVDSASAIMGHSMGGGASFLGCAGNTLPTAMVTMAAAETNPSAIAAATQITIPSLVLSADKDCVTPPEQHQLPMYDSLVSACKVFINVKGGGHCYFADANFLCSLGELGCPAFTITREQQQSATLDFTRLFLDYHLRGNAAAWTAFNDSLNASPRITFKKSCTITGLQKERPGHGVRIAPNPTRGVASIEGTGCPGQLVELQIFDAVGRTMMPGWRLLSDDRGNVRADLSKLLPGCYLASLTCPGNRIMVRLIRMN